MKQLIKLVLGKYKEAPGRIGGGSAGKGRLFQDAPPRQRHASAQSRGHFRRWRTWHLKAMIAKLQQPGKRAVRIQNYVLDNSACCPKPVGAIWSLPVLAQWCPKGLLRKTHANA